MTAHNAAPQSNFAPATQVSGVTGLCALVERCRSDRTPIVDYGVADHGLGNPPPQPHVHLALRGGLVEHYKRDMALRASAGCRIEELQNILRPHNQFIPIDADDDQTLGGCIAQNTYGPLRLTYGTMRNLLLGLSYIDAHGRDVRVGGRTVKNVAGYDMTRFMVGSLGEFGIIHEATLRTYPIPEHVLSLDLEIDEPSALDRGLTSWLVTDAAPAHHALLRREGKWTIRMAYFGKESTCAAQLAAMESVMHGATVSRLTAANHMTYPQDDRERAARRAWRRTAPALVKILVPPASTGATCMALANWSQQSRTPLEIQAMPVHGRIFTGGNLDADAAVKLNTEILRLIANTPGVLAWHNRPPGAESIPPFAPPQPDWPLLAKLKHTLDPDNLFNPGRFIPIEKVA